MLRTLKTTIPAALMGAGLIAAPAQAQEEVTIGLLGGISGPIAALAAPMIEASQLAVDQVNAQGGILGGKKLVAAVGDAACNPQGGTDAATKAVNVNNAVAVSGPHCSGSTLAAAQSVTIPAGVVLVSPSATSPELTKLDDNDTVFRTVPSDAYQGQALAQTVLDRGMDTVAVAYLNNDYGKGLAESFRAEFEANGGTITNYAGHEDGKASYRSDLAELASGGADTLVLFDYADGAGLTIMRQALENGFFTNFVGGDGMKSSNLIDELGAENLGGFVTSAPVGEKTKALQLFNKQFSEAGGDPDAVFVSTSYDAPFLLALAIEAAGSADRGAISEALRMVATAPGEPVFPGEWEKAVKLLAQGEDIDYKGASGDLEFDENGDVPGTYGLFAVEGDKLVQVTEM